METSKSGTLQTKGYGDSDSRNAKGWTKSHKVTLTGSIGPVEAVLTLKAEDPNDLEELVPMDRDIKRRITISPVDRTLDEISQESKSPEAKS